MARKNAAWYDLHNPTLAAVAASARNESVTRVVDAIVSAPATASTADHVLTRKSVARKSSCK